MQPWAFFVVIMLDMTISCHLSLDADIVSNLEIYYYVIDTLF